MERFAPSWRGSCPLCRADVSIYTLKDAAGQPIAKADAHTIFGLAFTQWDRVGFASYHFDTKDSCYISYANAEYDWVQDDGTPFPERKHFTDCSYDEDARTFKGAIEWNPPTDGETRWEYEIVFSEDFTCIIGGHNVSKDVEGTVVDISPFVPPWADAESPNACRSYIRWLEQSPSIFGSAYVRGYAYASALEGAASFHFDAEDDCYISYSNAPADWLLDDGSALPAKKVFSEARYDEATRILHAAVLWSPHFNGQARCEYQMLFSTDLSRIVGGTMQAYGADGSRKELLRFQDPATAEVVEESSHELFYVRKPAVFKAKPYLPASD